MTQHIYVKPLDGKKVRNEYTLAVIPPEGAWVKPTRFIARRIRDKDLEQCEPPTTDHGAEMAADAPVTDHESEA